MKYTKRGSGTQSLPPRNSCNAQGNPARPPGIEGVEMRKAYYNLLRNPARRIPCLAVPLFVACAAAAQQPPLHTASLEPHERMTITARPWTDAAKYKVKFSKKTPYAYAVLPLEVSLSNGSKDCVTITPLRI